MPNLHSILSSHVENQFYQASQLEEIGDWFMQLLSVMGITQIFGIPGAAIEPFYNAIGRAQKIPGNQLQLMTVKHEAAAAFAADGYYRHTGKPALCCSTAAPGITNLITGIASAKIERIPMIVVTAQVQMKDFESGAPQDSATHYLDTSHMLKEVCVYSTLITHPAQLIHKICYGLSYLTGANPGPVHFSFPLDLLKTKINQMQIKLPNPYVLMRGIAQHHNQISTQEFEKIANTIKLYQKDVTLVLGRDVGLSSTHFINIANESDWTILSVPDGKGLVDHDNPRYKGVIGLAGHSLAADHFIKTKGLILLVGTTFDQSCNGGWDTQSLPFGRIIQLNNTSADVQAFVPAHIRLSCDLLEFSKKLEHYFFNKTLLEKNFNNSAQPIFIENYHWDLMTLNPEKKSNRIKPQTFLWHLNQLAGYSVPICSDCSSSFLWTIHLWKSKPKMHGLSPNNFHLTLTFGSMGWAIGASLGIAQAIKERKEDTPSICITGDGSYLMSSQEIGTAAQLNLKLAIFVLNNSSYGLVEQCQKIVGAESIAYELPAVNYSQIASSHAVQGYEIRTKDDLTIAWQKFINGNGPALFDVYIDKDELPPFGNRLKNLGFNAKNS